MLTIKTRTGDELLRTATTWSEKKWRQFSRLVIFSSRRLFSFSLSFSFSITWVFKTRLLYTYLSVCTTVRSRLNLPTFFPFASLINWTRWAFSSSLLRTKWSHSLRSPLILSGLCLSSSLSLVLFMRPLLKTANLLLLLYVFFDDYYSRFDDSLFVYNCKVEKQTQLRKSENSERQPSDDLNRVTFSHRWLRWEKERLFSWLILRKKIQCY